jgi:hypothetical protein
MICPLKKGKIIDKFFKALIIIAVSAVACFHWLYFSGGGCPLPGNAMG